MAITGTTNLGLNQYGAGTDQMTRARYNADMAAIDAAFGKVGYIKKREACGTVSITPAEVNKPTGVYVPFPAGRFTEAPIVTVTAVSASPGTGVTEVTAGGISASGFTAYLTRTNITATGVMWHAIFIDET